ncbi:mutY [Mytilus coruscus]|uniref:Adenine DNA glycosylase n=1 Tax=Mytilus coruscus TaxID=42192 RepID=A0A6J8EGX7_MYTCO|nr:mutY [Mytilus coruscus]
MVEETIDDEHRGAEAPAFITNVGTESIHDFSSQEVKEFRELLVKWYSENKRDLPWRRQITNPDVNQRANGQHFKIYQKASLEEVNETWSGLGYYSRGRRLHEGAQKATGIVDGNVIRVLCRMRKMGGDSTNQPVQDKLVEFDKQEKTKELTKDKNKPIITDIECCIDSCPCIFRVMRNGIAGVQNYPRKGKKKAAREEQTKVCILCKKNKTQALYCIVQRPQKGLLAGLWEFPSLKLDGDSSKELSPQQLLIDSCGLHVDTVTSTCHVGEVVHLFSHIHQTYIIDSITVKDNDSDTVVTDHPSTRPLRWVTEEELQESAVSTAMKKVFKAYTEKMNSKTPAKTKKQKVDKKQPSINSFFKSKS